MRAKHRSEAPVPLVLLFAVIVGVAGCSRASRQKQAGHNAGENQDLREGAQQYEGFLCMGPEQSFFAQSEDELFDWSGQYTEPWVEFARTIDPHTVDDMVRLAAPLSSRPGMRRALWIRVVANVERKSGGGFGHLDAYDRRMTIERVLGYSPEPVRSALAHKATQADRN
ncbi:MAG TPA: hypothetical protein VJX67_03455 [Blastocatellia bacterium]|nr:hypothetical protein [Blastocatellia bacterium]